MHYKNVASDWVSLRKEALEILQKESELQEIVQLIGYDALPEPEKGILDTARSIREDFLQQSAYDDVDTYASIKKQHLMLSAILEFGRMEADAIKKGSSSAKIGTLEVRKQMSNIKWTKEEQVEQLVQDIRENMKKQFKRGDRIDAKFTIILGEDEITNNTLSIKNMVTKEQFTIKKEELEQWLDSNINTNH